MNRLATVAIAGSAALATATGGLAAGIATATPQATAPKAAATAERIDWGRCASPGLRELGLECGRLAVPLDHSEPDGETISLALSRLKATAPASQRQGPLIGEFRYFPVFSELLGERVTAEYDLIGFDYRGTGESKPLLDCGGKDPFRAPQPAYLPTTDGPDDDDDDGPLGLGGIGLGGNDDDSDNDDSEPGENERAWLDRWETFTDRCADKYGDELAHYNSTVDALDIEAVRVALGAPKISLYTESGYSREIYASEFGDRVHRVVLATAPDSRRAGYQGLLDDVDTETEHIRRFFAWIASHHDVYRLGRDADAIEDEYRAVERRLTRDPLKKFGPAEWSDSILFGAVFHESTWPDVASRFAAWVRGNRKPILRSANSFFTQDTTSATLQLVAFCADGEREDDYDRWRSDAFAAAEDAPDFAWRDTLNNLGCRTWPTSRGVDAGGSRASMLIISAEDDQARHEGALGLRERFPNSAYLTVTDSITDPVFTGSTCVDKAVKRYLKDGTLPDREDGDSADASCKKPKLPKPLKKDRERAQ